MIAVKSVTISKFRAFHPGESFELGEGVTLIAGLNGTAKSTLLGMICQPIGFPVTNKKSIYTNAYADVSLMERRTLFGTPFRSALSEVFRFSTKHDKPNEHDYVVKLTADKDILLKDFGETGLRVVSKARGGYEGDKIRIVTNSEDRDKGSGNFPHPVIYLGLDRLRPLSTVDTVNMAPISELNDEEKVIWRSIYSEVMLCTTSDAISSGLLDTGKNAKRKYESVNAADYDGESASAGQDNLSQLITAILSFYRLKKDLGKKYQGGVLLIDEVDATLHPFSQITLLNRLVEYAQALRIQIVVTTHSLILLQWASRRFKSHTKLLFLERREDGLIYLLNGITYEEIERKLALVQEKHKIRAPKSTEKMPVIFEDEVAASFFAAVTKNVFKDCLESYGVKGRNSETSLPNNVLASVAQYLAPKKIPGFAKVVYVLDGDSKRFLNKKTKNLVCLPGEVCAECEIYRLLKNDDGAMKCLNVNVQECFMLFNDIPNDPLLLNEKKRKDKYKEWFGLRRKEGCWGRGCAKVFGVWRARNINLCRRFCLDMISAICAADKEFGEKRKDQLLKRVAEAFPVGVEQ